MVLDASSPWPGDSLIAESPEIPAPRVLARYPVPAIAVVVANAAFAEKLGHSRDAVTSISYDDIPLFEVLMERPSRRAEPGVRPQRSGAQQCRTTPMSDGATQCR